MLSPIEKECLTACNACAAACWQCASACLKEQDPQTMARCIQLDLGCADLCQLAAAAIARGDGASQAICTLCAKVCKDCAAECIQHAMAHCQECAQACQRCADACHRMGG